METKQQRVDPSLLGCPKPDKTKTLQSLKDHHKTYANTIFLKITSVNESVIKIKHYEVA